MPGAVGRTSTIALCNATLPYALRIANKGYEKAAAEDPGLAEGINMVGGRVTHAAVAEALHLPYQPLRDQRGGLSRVGIVASSVTSRMRRRCRMSDRMRQLQRMLNPAPAGRPVPALRHRDGAQEGRRRAAARSNSSTATIRTDPGYCYAYYQRGQVHESLGDDGTGAKAPIATASTPPTKKGDAHARGELEAALDLLG